MWAPLFSFILLVLVLVLRVWVRIISHLHCSFIIVHVHRLFESMHLCFSLSLSFCCLFSGLLVSVWGSILRMQNGRWRTCATSLFSLSLLPLILFVCRFDTTCELVMWKGGCEKKLNGEIKIRQKLSRSPLLPVDSHALFLCCYPWCKDKKKGMCSSPLCSIYSPALMLSHILSVVPGYKEEYA